MYVTCIFIVLTCCQNFSDKKFKQKNKNSYSVVCISTKPDQHLMTEGNPLLQYKDFLPDKFKSSAANIQSVTAQK